MTSFTNSLKKFALIGYPLGHSISPQIHERIFDSYGINATYDLIEIKPDEFDTSIKSVIKTYDGFNITVPYKQRIEKYLQKIDVDAKKIHSVNTVFNSDGFNTDFYGLQTIPFNLNDKKVLMIGAGGVAYTVAHYLLSKQVSRLSIISRTNKKTSQLACAMRDIHPTNKIDELTPSILAKQLQSETYFDIAINCTSAGMWPHVEELPLPIDLLEMIFNVDSFEGVFDVIYNPMTTRFMELAQSYDKKSVGGLRMLVLQAFEAERLWNPEIQFENQENIIHRLFETEIKKHAPLDQALQTLLNALG